MKIVVKWVRGVCEAVMHGRPEVRARGKSIGEAIGNLVKEHNTLFLVDIEEDSGSAGSA